jgi:hypothetical protein
VWRSLPSYLAKAPGTHVLLLTVTVTTLMQRGLDETTATRVLRHASTNLFHMTRDAPRVLFLSAFLLDHGHLLVEIVLFTLVMVPVERWIGTYRWLAVFAAGHVGATMATTVGIWLQVRSGTGGSDLVYPIDVGVSYGLYAVAGVLPRRLPRPAAIVVVAIVAYAVGHGIVSSGSYTDWGHATAFAIGLAMGPLVDPRVAAAATRGSVRWSIAGGWHWLSSPPARSGRRLFAQSQVLGASALACASALLAFLIWNGHQDIQLPTGTARVVATVVDPLPACTKPCTNAVVRYRVGTVVYQKTLRLPAGVSVRRGENLELNLDPTNPELAQAPRPARRVNVDGLLGATAIALAGAGVVALAQGRRRTATKPDLTRATNVDGQHS